MVENRIEMFASIRLQMRLTLENYKGKRLINIASMPIMPIAMLFTAKQP